MSTSHDNSRSLLGRLFGSAQPSRRRVLGAAGLGAAGVARGALAPDLAPPLGDAHEADRTGDTAARREQAEGD
ncbi:hypothetical protein, partial [Streptomyces vinaceus]|uniref:hypothetical protein n=1 Tax=Streptomyces vinaceus TaxID=1960 RepID=UPI00368BBE59